MRAAVLALLLVAGQAQAAFMSGNKLLSFIDSAKPEQNTLALGYVIGIADGFDRAGGICTPPDATAGQLRDVVAAYLRAYPERRHIEAAASVVVALTAAFGCDPKRGDRL